MLTSSKPENYEKWLSTLENTTERQGKAKLCTLIAGDTYGGPERAYCCLGLGSHLAGLPESEDFGMVFFDGREDLAPGAFINWLGFDHVSEDNEWDIVLDTDLPEMRGPGASGLTAAAMNDSGFTFAQIAQMFRYFGVKDFI